MNCYGCGRALKSQKSRELGYGPVCYKKIFGTSAKIRGLPKKESTDDFPYYNIPGQMTLDDYLNSDKGE